ncbi:probable leucine-rich repeat receptor-like protein kinase At1g68400 [Hordeum vulgare subsp. vulgare]|uniref:Protein kinase domain-containing protein n=1 Tax=Hordeum vulgare subsp. vulgare TaxID=112509 RepID=A0A8I6XBW5_HORVV|nr:probable leucine-rich repeat receptor-like protein kinase At1g68400 [Hordeum vulgare subsp. vulgare]
MLRYSPAFLFGALLVASTAEISPHLRLFKNLCSPRAARPAIKLIQSSSVGMASKMPRFRYCFSMFRFPLVILLFHLSTWLVHGEVANGGHCDLPFLLSFKAYNPNNVRALETWVGTDPCSGSWLGVRCSRGRVAGVFLDDASLVGSVAPLLGLTQIRVLAVRRNSLSGPLSPLDNSTSPRLRHLLVSHNNLSGGLNLSLPSLLTLRAERNGFHGGLQALCLPMLRKFNVSSNKLVGEIPASLSRFPSSSFGSNVDLCSKPLPRCIHAYNAVEDGTTSNGTTNVTQSPSAATNTTSGSPSSSSNGRFGQLGMTALVATGIGNAVLIAISLAISVALFIYMRRKLRPSKDDSKSSASLCFEEEDKMRNAEEKCQKSGALVCFDGGEELRLESLLKASAEVLGKGVSGSTYKAVLEDGIVAAVKRLSALQFPGRSKAFDRHMRLVGRLRHRHVVSLRGYCNSNGERLLVYDYLPNGSLQSLLQGNGGGGRTRSLDWATKKSILFGAAQGLNYIHTFPARPALVHGNVKPSNILLDERGAACVSEWGLTRYAASVQHSAPQPPELFLDRATAAVSSLGGWRGYAAPELTASGARATQESDVYSFGMVLLAVVTAKGAADGGEDEGEGEETMGMVKIGVLCTAEAPEERPRMAQVLTMMSEFM